LKAGEFAFVTRAFGLDARNCLPLRGFLIGRLGPGRFNLAAQSRNFVSGGLGLGRNFIGRGFLDFD
jgi:hypothetical protein